jgi:hypothetical protein
MRSVTLLSVLCLVSLSAACQPRKPPAPVAPVSRVSPELKAALEKAVACNYENGAFDKECEGVKAWDANSELANAELLELLSTDDTKARTLIAEKLSVQLTADNADTESLTHVLEVAEKEKVDSIAKALAGAAAKIDLGKFGLLDRGIAIAKAHGVHGYQEIYANGLKSESEPDKVAAYAGELAKSEDKALRNAALRMYGNLKTTRPEAACTGLEALRADKEASLAHVATSELARESKCAPQHDGILTAFEALKLPKNPASAEPFVGHAVEGICQNKDKTPAQRDRSLALAKQISETAAIQADTRSHTLSAVLACDPKGGPAFLKKFTKDKDATVAAQAKSLLESIPKTK